jgi:hypothetical protein
MLTTTSSALTTSHVAKQLGVARHTLLRWLRANPELEPEHVVRFEGAVRYRAFTAGDIEKLRKYQLALHPRGWVKGPANAEHVPAGGRYGATEMENANVTVAVEKLENGAVQITLVGKLPHPTVAENEKWPWAGWQVRYQQGLLQKDAERLLQSLANFEHVEGIVESRSQKRLAERAEKIASRQLVAAAVEAPSAVIPAAVEVEAPVSDPGRLDQIHGSGNVPVKHARAKAGKRAAKGAR